MSVDAALVELELARADYLTRFDELDAERAATVQLLDRCEDAIAAVKWLVNPLDTPAGRPIELPATSLAETSAPKTATIACKEAGCGRTFGTLHGLQVHHGRKHGPKVGHSRLVAVPDVVAPSPPPSATELHEDHPSVGGNVLALRCEDCDHVVPLATTNAVGKFKIHARHRHERDAHREELIPSRAAATETG